MKSFVKYVEAREAEDAGYNAVRDAYRGFSGWRLRNADQGNLEKQAITSLQAVIDYMAKSTDTKIKGLYSGGYAGELYSLSQWFQGKDDPRYAQADQDRQDAEDAKDAQAAQDAKDAQDAKQEGYTGAIAGAAAGALLGGIPGAVWGGAIGHGGQKLWNATMSGSAKAMRELNNLENQAMKALQAVVNRLNHDKGEKYQNGFAQRLQGWITRMKGMQQFNNQPRKTEVDPERGWTYKKVYNQPKTPPATAPRANAPATTNAPAKSWFEP